MRHIINRHKALWPDKIFRNSVVDSVLLLLFSLVVNYYAATYASIRASNYVNDLFLDNLPIVNVSLVFIDGFILFILFIIFLLVRRPSKIPFVAKSIALFTIVRAIFMTLTHLGPFPQPSYLDTGDIVQKFVFTGDLFFSGHTGLPFLMALIFWDSVRLREVFITSSIIFASSALLGHLHYSIDVFAAYFITYGIFKIAQKLFAKDRKFIDN